MVLRFLAPPNPRSLLVFCVGLGIVLTIGVGSLNWVRYYQLTKGGLEAEGWVEALEPENHQLVRYAYVVDLHLYRGTGTAGYGNPEFRALRTGSRLRVFYLPTAPQVSVIGNPRDRLTNETASIAALAVLGPLFVFLTNWLRIRRLRTATKELEGPSR